MKKNVAYDPKDVKAELEKPTCKTHNQYPVVTIGRKWFVYDTCCKSFEAELDKLAKQITTGAVKDLVDKVLEWKSSGKS